MARGVMAKKKNKSDKFILSYKQLEKVKAEVASEATSKACLINIAAMADCFGLNEDQVCELAETVTRYATYLDDNILKINAYADMIEEKTGVKFTKF